ncbi:37930_t:CDS:2, partial [Gigaspora margarita]
SALSLLVAELEKIQSSFFDLASNYWNIVFYLFADWKFLSICQGHKAANSKNYCLWYLVKKTQNRILKINNIHQDNWMIFKNIENLVINYTKSSSYINKLLFLIIPIQNWVVNHLYFMLRITDKLWTLVIGELKNTKRYNDKIYQTISREMLRFNVKFLFEKIIKLGIILTLWDIKNLEISRKEFAIKA